MDKLKGMMPKSVKVPKKLRKMKKWNNNLTLDTIGSTIGNNISQLVNRFYPQTDSNEGKNPPENEPPGVSTISGSYVADSVPSTSQKSNFGLYALKHDRNKDRKESGGGKKGLQLLHIPKLRKDKVSSTSKNVQKEIVHEKFQPCKSLKDPQKSIERGQSSSLDESIGSVNDCTEVHFDIESDLETSKNSKRVQLKPAVPPRRRKPSQSSVTTVVPKEELSVQKFPQEKPKPSPRKVPPAPEPPTKPEVKSLGTFVAQNRPEQKPQGTRAEPKRTHARNKSVDIFVKKPETEVFQDFDNFFDKSAVSSSSSSSNQSSFDQKMAELRSNTERRFSQIKVQNFNETSKIPRCKSIISPKHQQKAIDSESSSNELKSPKIVTDQAKKMPQGILKQKTPSSPRDGAEEQRMPFSPRDGAEEQKIPQRKFFVYYNDEDELVFNQEYQKQVEASKNSQPLSLFMGCENNNQILQQQKLSLSDFNHNDVIYRNYFNNADPNDSLRSMASSSDGIFI
ncbi:nucleolar protein dao-5-like [Culicoides brevitarsis]|uniref:nucleolar protein dao-5-like n=1 Tax=Culicoides brevitarsis TaxID=469753 RepID=UPI00307C0221